MKNKIIIDNALSVDDFKNLENLILSDNFPWYYKEYQTNQRKDNSYFYHLFFSNCNINSNHYGILNPILNLIKPISLINVRANLIINRPNSNSNYHMDTYKSKNYNYKTAIFYINTNNGYTEFKEDNEKVESIANRIVIFPAELYHRAVGQTDKDRRIVINFNFYDDD